MARDSPASGRENAASDTTLFEDKIDILEFEAGGFGEEAVDNGNP